MHQSEAEQIAIDGLAHIAGEPELLSRFAALSGIDPQAMREAAGEPGFLAGVLEFYLGDEPTLLAFSAMKNIDPNVIAKAHAYLVGH